MSQRLYPIAAVVVLSLVGASSAVAPAAGTLPRSGTTFQVTSSLDGKRVLPIRSRWLVYPKVSTRKVREVDFLIDRKLRWIEHKAPYNYASDDFKGHLGYLITTWLTPGTHSFVSRVVDTSGHRVTHTNTARVLPAPKPPARLAGKWTRTLTPDDAKKATSGQPPPTGVWKLVIDRVGAWALDPMGSGVVDQYTATDDGGLKAYAPITMAVKGVAKYGATGIGCCECREDGPFGSYTWSVAGDNLSIKAKRDQCGDRQAIWEGTWKRVS
ncbi:hypothetical protein AYO48_01195 [Gaiella sp. SCGC AG-212-M14]|nr:hypothetical protein AYO48_01195 [Gaiella sp. SCGC AG-212-M14]